MGRKKKENVGAGDEGLEVAETAKIEVSGGKNKIDIYNPRDFSYVRTFSKERHGADYEALADQFCQKHGMSKGKAVDRGEDEK